MIRRKLHRLRGLPHGESVEVLERDVSGVGTIAWSRWERELANTPLRTLLALVYAEGLYHGYELHARQLSMLRGQPPAQGGEG